jgi:hypothetical protein
MIPETATTSQQLQRHVLYTGSQEAIHKQTLERKVEDQTNRTVKGTTLYHRQV